VDMSSFTAHLADCVVLTHDHKLLMQYRPLNWRSSPAPEYFGGHVDRRRTVMQALVRELKEELGAEVIEDDVIKLGAITEDSTQHRIGSCSFLARQAGHNTGCMKPRRGAMAAWKRRWRIPR